MLIAGLYNQSGHVILLTNWARDYLMDIHHRMPYVLTEEEIDDWIDPKVHVEEALAKTLDENHPKWHSLVAYKAPLLVNKLTNKSSQNIMTISEY